MTFKSSYMLIGAALLALSGYSIADPGLEPSTVASEAAVIVTGSHPTDFEIRSEVVRRIHAKPALGLESIDVQSFDREVYLYGVANSRIDSEVAEELARTTPGVRKVYNGLGVFGG